MKCLLALLGFVLLQLVVLAQDSKPRDMHEMHRLHQDPKAYIAMLDDPRGTPTRSRTRSSRR
jgi:hypothetical protein